MVDDARTLTDCQILLSNCLCRPRIATNDATNDSKVTCKKAQTTKEEGSRPIDKGGGGNIVTGSVCIASPVD